MSGKRPPVTRRSFFRGAVGAGVGAAALGRMPESLLAAAPDAPTTPQAAGVPLIITSHDNETGQDAARQAWQILADGGSALDAVERCANVIEVDPDDHSVGYGGLPNQDGVVQLDASIMDGRTYNAGSVASLENIVNASSVARMVMERTDHVMLVGPGALAFATSFGFEETDLLTEEAREIWVRWRERHAPDDDWGPPDHLRGLPGTELGMDGPIPFHYGTTNCLAVDANGDVAGITTTSGLSWKIPGRIGDSPIIGAGLYVDNQVGAAGATGRGEDVIKSCASFYIVSRMRDGRSPQEACEDAIALITDNYRAIGSDFYPEEKFVAVSKDGDVGCAWMGISDSRPQMTVHNQDGQSLFEGTTFYRP